MQPHQQRVVAEKVELDEKIVKLRGFFGTTTWENVDPLEQDRMMRQYSAMSEYSNILGERIAAFGGV